MEEVKFRLVNKYIGKVYPEFMVDNCIVEHNLNGVSLYSGGELIGSVGIYGGLISFHSYGSNVVRNVDSTFGEEGLFMEWFKITYHDKIYMEWFKITYHDKIYNVNVIVPPF